MSGFEAERPIRELNGVPRKRKIDLLTKGIPGLIKDANMGCKMAVKQYIHIAEGHHWKDVSNSLEEYLLTYWEKSPAWFESLRSIVQTFEKGASYTQPLNAVLTKAKAQPLPYPSPGPGRGNKTDYNVTDFPKGNSREYLAARLARDCPEILDEIGKGKKYRSLRAAAIAVGMIKPKVTIQFPPEESGSQIAGRLHQKLSDEQLIELRDVLNDYFGG